jgi:hypothetical protein
LKKWAFSISLVIIGLLLLAVGIYIGETDDAPGAGGLGILMMVCFCWLSWKTFHKYSK